MVELNKKVLPMQPVGTAEDGILRFRENRVVSKLLDLASERGVNLNTLVFHANDCPQEEWEQFYQLIGYSLSGYGSLGRVSEISYDTAAKMAHDEIEDSKDARILALEECLYDVKVSLRDGVARLYGRHPDDLIEVEEEEENG